MNAWNSLNAADRNPRTDDTGTIRELYTQLSDDVLNLDKDFALLLDDPNDRCLILEERVKPVGMVICYIRLSLSSGKKMVIEEHVIDHRYRRRPFGSLLTHHCIDLAKAEKPDRVELACSLSKSELLLFYERIGLKHRMRLYSLIIANA